MAAFAYFETLAAQGFRRLYEQKQTAQERAAALDDYLRRWKRLTTAGLNGLALSVTLPAFETDPREAELNSARVAGAGTVRSVINPNVSRALSDTRFLICDAPKSQGPSLQR